jgi:UDP-glucose 4-epimerase
MTRYVFKMPDLGEGTVEAEVVAWHINVGDVVNCLMKLVDEPKAVGQVFNIGNKEEVTILKLAEIVKSLTGSASPIEFVPYDKAYEEGFEDMPRRVPDLAKVSQLVGYEPKVQLNEIITKVIDYFRTHGS